MNFSKKQINLYWKDYTISEQQLFLSVNLFVFKCNSKRQGPPSWAKYAVTTSRMELEKS